ncbi:MAG TPA: FAD-dependent monooxygenase [Edaphocola sp.]|nr:FAD-dependent monooxygenase [Edaphocola sp.]
MDKEIIIIGAGIGGLTTALALKQINKPVSVYESTSDIKPVGAGIVMANNAMQIFDKLGVRKKIEAAGCKISNIRITDAQLNNISVINLKPFELKYGVYNLAIHRADLQKILAEALGLQNINLAKRLLKIEEDNNFKLYFEDGTTANCETLIGADGINSVVRNQLFKTGKIRDSKQRCWRGIMTIDETFKYKDTSIESWGKGKRFGFVKISETKLYWFAVINKGLEEAISLVELFKEFHPDILKIIEATAKEDIIYNEIADLEPITQWYKSKACLLGDAAHATTPNMGQGACQAVEDAYTLATLFQQEKSIEAIFSQFEQIRIKKAHFIVNTSWSLGKVAQYENAFAIFLRNIFLKMLPNFFKKRQLNKVFNIDYITERAYKNS